MAPSWNLTLFQALNQSPSWLDPATKFFSSDLIWVLAVFAGLLVLARNFRNPRAWLALLSIPIAAGLADGLSYYFLKFYFASPRPCYALDLNTMRILAPACGSQFGFPSNHATNAMACAVVSALWVQKRGFTVFALGLALLIGLSRILMGVHWPSDVLAGFAVGGGVGALVYWAFSRAKLSRPIRKA